MRLRAAVLVAALLCASCAAGAERRIVFDQVVPIMDVGGAAVYGNIVEIEDEGGGMASLLVDGKVGRIETAGMARIPSMIDEEARYIVREDDPELRLLPIAEWTTLRRWDFTLLRGEVVRSRGRTIAAGREWLMLEFESAQDWGTGGIGPRFAWAPAEALVPLAGYEPSPDGPGGEWMPARLRISTDVLSSDLISPDGRVAAVSQELRDILLEESWAIDAPVRRVSFDELEKCRVPAFLNVDLFVHAYRLLVDEMIMSVERTDLAPKLESSLLSARAALEALTLPPELEWAHSCARDAISMSLSYLGGDGSDRYRRAAGILSAIGYQFIDSDGKPREIAPDKVRIASLISLALASSEEWAELNDILTVLMGEAGEMTAFKFAEIVRAQLRSGDVSTLADPDVVRAIADAAPEVSIMDKRRLMELTEKAYIADVLKRHRAQSSVEQDDKGEIVDEPERLEAAQFVPPMPRGYVEAEPELIGAVADECMQFATYLNEHELCGAERDHIEGRLVRLAAAAEEAARIARAEAEGAEISASDYEQIAQIARQLADWLVMTHGGEEAEDAVQVCRPRPVWAFVDDRWGGPRAVMGWTFSVERPEHELELPQR